MEWGRSEWNLVELRMGLECSDFDIDNFCVLYLPPDCGAALFLRLKSVYNLSV